MGKIAMSENAKTNPHCQEHVHGIGSYDCGCLLITSKGPQCRTEPLQRPCGDERCARAECGAAGWGPRYAPLVGCPGCGSLVSIEDRICGDPECFATNIDTKNDSTGPESAPDHSAVHECTYTLTGVSEADIRILLDALVVYRNVAPPGIDYRQTDDLGAKIMNEWLAH